MITDSKIRGTRRCSAGLNGWNSGSDLHPYKEPDRLALAERLDATAVNFAESDPTEVIMECADGFGVDCGVEHPEMVLDKLVEVVRATGRLGVVRAQRGYESLFTPLSPLNAVRGEARFSRAVVTGGAADRG